jgi:signal peptidase I
MSWLSDFLKMLFPPKYEPTLERPSPKIRITEAQARAILAAITLIPGYENCSLAAIDVTNSMEPGIDDGMYAVLDPLSYTDLIVGDIIYYESPEFRAIHRIVEIGADPDWYCRTKGDNNSLPDPVKVKPEHIKGVWRATLN